MPKIIHITDPHLVATGRNLHGLDPATHLETVFAHIEAQHADAEAIIITGDLADEGEPDAYQRLKDFISRSVIPVHLTLGNHDRRSAFRQIFGGVGTVTAAVDLGEWKIVLLDTLDERGAMGLLEQDQLEWFDSQLSEAADQSIVVAMHHPPHSMHMPAFERMRLSSEPFFDSIQRHGNVRHILFGHIHVGTGGTIRGVPFSSSRGSFHHIAVDFRQTGRSTFVVAHPSYDVVFLQPDAVIVHRQDGLHTLPVIRPGDPI